MLGLKLNRVSKRGHWLCSLLCRITSYNTVARCTLIYFVLRQLYVLGDWTTVYIYEKYILFFHNPYLLNSSTRSMQWLVFKLFTWNIGEIVSITVGNMLHYLWVQLNWCNWIIWIIKLWYFCITLCLAAGLSRQHRRIPHRIPLALFPQICGIISWVVSRGASFLQHRGSIPWNNLTLKYIGCSKKNHCDKAVKFAYEYIVNV